MNIAVIDAEIVGKTRHRFPNLCCMKISAYHKSLGDTVTLKTDYDNLEAYDKVYISKVFIKTEIPFEPLDRTLKKEDTVAEYYAAHPLLNLPNVLYGGTGFFYDKAPPLPCEIEHSKPDYTLYNDWVAALIKNGAKRSEFIYYLDYSIGYLTRKCFRGCYFCVNRNYNGAEAASPLSEFIDYNRPKICLLDDNFLAFPKWRDLIASVVASGKRFQFKQGLDERLLTANTIKEIASWKYDKEVIFAFDNIEDKELIISKLKLLRSVVPNWKRELKFYVFCGCAVDKKYNRRFFEKDISSVFERIHILRKYGAKPYIMRHEDVYQTEYSSFYAALAAYCNQPAMFKTFSFRLFCQCRGMRRNGYKIYKRNVTGYLADIGIKGSEWRAMEKIEREFPDIAATYYDEFGLGGITE